MFGRPVMSRGKKSQHDQDDMKYETEATPPFVSHQDETQDVPQNYCSETFSHSWSEKIERAEEDDNKCLTEPTELQNSTSTPFPCSSSEIQRHTEAISFIAESRETSPANSNISESQTSSEAQASSETGDNTTPLPMYGTFNVSTASSFYQTTPDIVSKGDLVSTKLDGPEESKEDFDSKYLELDDQEAELHRNLGFFSILSRFYYSSPPSRSACSTSSPSLGIAGENRENSATSDGASEVTASNRRYGRKSTAYMSMLRSFLGPLASTDDSILDDQVCQASERTPLCSSSKVTIPRVEERPTAHSRSPSRFPSPEGFGTVGNIVQDRPRVPTSLFYGYYSNYFSTVLLGARTEPEQDEYIRTGLNSTEGGLMQHSLSRRLFFLRSERKAYLRIGVGVLLMLILCSLLIDPASFRARSEVVNEAQERGNNSLIEPLQASRRKKGKEAQNPHSFEEKTSSLTPLSTKSPNHIFYLGENYDEPEFSQSSLPVVSSDMLFAQKSKSRSKKSREGKSKKNSNRSKSKKTISEDLGTESDSNSSIPANISTTTTTPDTPPPPSPLVDRIAEMESIWEAKNGREATTPIIFPPSPAGFVLEKNPFLIATEQEYLITHTTNFPLLRKRENERKKAASSSKSSATTPVQQLESPQPFPSSPTPSASQQRTIDQTTKKSYRGVQAPALTRLRPLNDDLLSAVRFFHISDTHVDPFFNPLQTMQAGVCHSCKLSSAVFEEQAHCPLTIPEYSGISAIRSGYSFGRYRCNPGPRLLRSLISQLRRQNSTPDFIVITGDLGPHGYPDDNYAAGDETLLSDLCPTKFLVIQEHIRMLKQAFPRTPIAFTLGNNDHLPKNTFWAPYIRRLGTMFYGEGLLNAEQYQDFVEVGSYYLDPIPGLRVINPDLTLFTPGGEVGGTPLSPEEERKKELDGTTSLEQEAKTHPVRAKLLAWMAGVLADAKAKGLSVLLVGHQPLTTKRGRDEMDVESAHYNLLKALLSDYSSIIRAAFFGHRNMAGLQTIKGPLGQPIIPSITVPGVSPRTNNQPSFHEVYLDPKDFQVLEFEQWVFDLLSENTIAMRLAIEDDIRRAKQREKDRVRERITRQEKMQDQKKAAKGGGGSSLDQKAIDKSTSSIIPASTYMSLISQDSHGGMNPTPVSSQATLMLLEEEPQSTQEVVLSADVVTFAESTVEDWKGSKTGVSQLASVLDYSRITNPSAFENLDASVLYPEHQAVAEVDLISQSTSTMNMFLEEKVEKVEKAEKTSEQRQSRIPLQYAEYQYDALIISQLTKKRDGEEDGRHEDGDEEAHDASGAQQKASMSSLSSTIIHNTHSKVEKQFNTLDLSRDNDSVNSDSTNISPLESSHIPVYAVTSWSTDGKQSSSTPTHEGHISADDYLGHWGQHSLDMYSWRAVSRAKNFTLDSLSRFLSTAPHFSREYFAMQIWTKGGFIGDETPENFKCKALYDEEDAMMRCLFPEQDARCFDRSWIK